MIRRKVKKMMKNLNKKIISEMSTFLITKLMMDSFFISRTILNKDNNTRNLLPGGKF